MKIVHMCLASFFPDGYSYQENMLPKFHKLLGHEVEVLASLVTFDKNGKITLLDESSSYINEYGIPITRFQYKRPYKLYRKLRRYIGVEEALEKAAPDVLFIHGCQFLDMDVVVKYLKKHPNVKVYVDNHADFSNSATNFLSKNILHKIIWKRCAHIIEPFTTKFYGVLPARVDFLVNVYGLPANKCELLVMGADDEKVQEAVEGGEREKIRTQYGIKQEDFLVMTGGKIDAWKTQTLDLMKAVRNIEDTKVKLIVFGSVTPELQDKVKELADGEKVQYIGWIDSKESYKYFVAADLVTFPGRHSVFWEQVVAQGIPMLCKYWEGTTHVDVGGNVVFLKEDSVEEIETRIVELTTDSNLYQKMLHAAQSKGKEEFSYSHIAKKSIDI